MVRAWRAAQQHDHAHNATHRHNPRLSIGVRKRPRSHYELSKQDPDAITCLDPVVWCHALKFRVDGITKFVDHSSFKFDYAFDESVTNEQLYNQTTLPLLDFVCQGIGGRATVFAYGQTGTSP
jgi:kinesin family member 2/24